MMMELRQKQLRDYILNCKQEAEKADSNDECLLKAESTPLASHLLQAHTF